MFQFELGSKVKCMVTGFSGVVTGRSEYLSGCINYCVKPPIDEKGNMTKGEWVDEPQLELVDTVLADQRKSWPTYAYAGGPQADQAPER